MAKYKYTEEELIETALLYKEHFASHDTWDAFASKQELPSASSYKRRFGSWETAMITIFGKYTVPEYKRYTKEKLIEIAITHSRKFTKKRDWDKFAKEKGLPTGFTYRSYFGSWNEAKLEAGLEETKVKKRSPSYYSVEEMKRLAKVHKEQFDSLDIWNEFARINKLPSASTYARYFGNGSWSKAKEELGLTKIRKGRYSKEELIEIALENMDFVYSKGLWDKMAKEKGLPWSSSYRIAFGSWSIAKKAIKKEFDLMNSNVKVNNL